MQIAACRLQLAECGVPAEGRKSAVCKPQSAIPGGVRASAVVLSYNKREYTRRCLQSVAATDFGGLEIIVIDQGSADGTREWLQVFAAECAGRGLPVRLILNERNVGACTGRNQGIAAASGRFLAFLDNDVVVADRSWLSRLTTRLEAQADAGIVTAKLVYPDPPHRIQFAGCAVSPGGRILYLGRGEARDDPRFNEERELQCAISACIVVKREVIERVGGFDEAFNPVQYEDLDLCYRARAAGYRVRYFPGVEALHYENVTTDGSPDLNFRYLTIKHGLLFKERWRHMFAHEGGPDDREAHWKTIDRPRLPPDG
ncbi:MAG: glycosyltransferase family 2 protein [Armatimonadetes bacterium]|nr:glycosyltransferase family 2 protein [Armatimonadota bacterium]